MKIETLEVNAALRAGMQLPHAMIRSLSAVTLGPPPAEVDLDELLEARFFCETKEIRIFRRDMTLEAVKLSEDANDPQPIRRTYRLANPKFGGSITICHELRADEDGQTYVCTSRLAGWQEDR